MPASQPSFIDPPFLAPIETTLNLPRPPSVNRTRKVDWKFAKVHKAWILQADMQVMVEGGLRRLAKMPGKFEATLILDEGSCNLDLDNACKAVIDYARRLELIIDDDKRHMRRLTIEWGKAEHGCRLILRSVAA